MARAVGIRSSRIDMMAFGLGSGLARFAGCALAQVGNVRARLGAKLHYRCFPCGGCGWCRSGMGWSLQPWVWVISGTVLEIGIGRCIGKIILLVLVILFIQKRPQGLFAIKGRFVE